MPEADSIVLRLNLIEEQARPGNFGALLTLTTELSELVSKLPDLDQPYTSYLKLMVVIRLILANVTESDLKGLLVEVGQPEEGTSLDPEILALASKLPAPDLRAYLLALMLHSSAACSSLFILKLNKPQMNEIAWFHLAQATHIFPVLLPLASSVNSEVINLEAKAIEKNLRIPELEDLGYKLIDIEGAIGRSWLAAWGKFVESSAAPSERRLELLRDSSAGLHMILNFMLLSEGRSWRIGEFWLVRRDTSLPAILMELGSRSLKPIGTDHVLTSVLYHNEKGMMLDDPTKHYEMTRGVIRKTKYLVRPPGFDCFCDVAGASMMAEWEEDPLRFAYNRLDQIPRSARVAQLIGDATVVDNALQNANLDKHFNESLKELSPELLSVVVVESAHLPAIVGPFLTALFRRLFQLLSRSSKNVE